MLGSGTQLGQYQIVASIGAGGMGEVYRARDSKLGRDVAIKLLPDLYAQDPERLARFQREAQLLASLSHPNIGVIYDLQESGGKRYLVLELIEGESLAQRLLRGPLPVDEAIDIAWQVADALEAAHEKNVLHRDLKPANIQLGADGRTRVLDFGLAKILEPDPDAAPLSNSPTAGLDRTGHGVILGTVAYMSPEQARGRAVDKRTDIWAFGCVLYEMLTAKQAFSGESVADIIASIVKTDPEWACLPPDTPSTLRSILEHCLRKNAKQRLHEIADARIFLEAVKQEPAAMAAQSTVIRSRTNWAAIIGLLVLLPLAGFVAARFIGTRSARGAFTQLTMDIRPADDFGVRPHRTAIAITPDGRTMVFSAVKDSVVQLYRRSLDEGQATAIPGTEGGQAPFLSPDGEWIGFWSGGKLRKIPIGGGPTAVICDIPGTFGVHWGDGDVIVFSDGNVIFSVAAAGGTPKPITTADKSKEEQNVLPQLLPGGKEVLFTSVMQSNWDDARIIAQNRATGEKHTVIQGGVDGRYLKSGYLLYLESGKLLGVSFDLASLRTRGSPVALLDGVMQATNTKNFGNETGAGQFFVSESGTLAYMKGGVEPEASREMDWVTRKGEAQTLSRESAPYFDPRLSPDGGTVAFIRFLNFAKSDVWTMSTALGTPSLLTFNNANHYPIWSPNGKSIVFASNVSGAQNLYEIPTAGGTPERLTTSPFNQYPSSWSEARRAILYLEHPEILTNKQQIWVLPMEGDRTPKLFLDSANFRLSYAEFSPDGRWIAYASNESDTREIYVQPYPATGEKYHISTSGGGSSAWSRNGRELFYRVYTKTGGFRMMAVDVTTNPTFTFGTPKLLFEGDYDDTEPVRGWDVSEDGQHFLMVHNAPPEKPVTEMHIVLNWTQELQRRVGR